MEGQVLSQIIIRISAAQDLGICIVKSSPGNSKALVLLQTQIAVPGEGSVPALANVPRKDHGRESGRGTSQAERAPQTLQLAQLNCCQPSMNRPAPGAWHAGKLR